MAVNSLYTIYRNLLQMICLVRTTGDPPPPTLEQGNNGGDECLPCRPGLESKVAVAFGPWPVKFGIAAVKLPTPPISRDHAARLLPARVHADETHAEDVHAAHTHVDLAERLGERDGRCCHAAVTERARSSEPSGAAAAAGERPRRKEEGPKASDGPWLRLTCSWFRQWVIRPLPSPHPSYP